MSAAFTTSPKLVADGEDNWGRSFIRFFDCVGNSSYPSGGYAVTPATFGLQVIRGIFLAASNVAGAVGNYYIASGLPGSVSGGDFRIWIGASEQSSTDSGHYYRLMVIGE